MTWVEYLPQRVSDSKLETRESEGAITSTLFVARFRIQNHNSPISPHPHRNGANLPNCITTPRGNPLCWARWERMRTIQRRMEEETRFAVFSQYSHVRGGVSCVHRTCEGLDQDRESSTTHFVFRISSFSRFPVAYSAQSVDEKDGG